MFNDGPLEPAATRLMLRELLERYYLFSFAAVELLMGTAAVESNFGQYRRQVIATAQGLRPLGTARGAWQVEPITERDCWQRFLQRRENWWMRIAIKEEWGIVGPAPGLMERNDRYCALIARIKYRLCPGALPAPNDIHGQAAYWKKWYNTPLGAGREEQYVAKYYRYCFDRRENKR